jgi:CHAT domain-containing protein
MVPDATYEDSAFSALWDEARGRYLIEDRTISVAPSVMAFVAASAPNPIAGGDRPLIVGGPNRSADAIAAEYSDPTVVTGSAATRARLLAGVRDHAVVHLSAQTAANAAYPMLSRVLLVDEPGHRYSGDVLGREIAAQSLSHTKLVVLDEVYEPTRNRGDGTLSLARAFMTAGVRTVVGTLPGADETAVRELMVGLHRRLASGMPAAEALATLQRNVLQSNGRRLGAWSALVLYGSDR